MINLFAFFLFFFLSSFFQVGCNGIFETNPLSGKDFKFMFTDDYPDFSHQFIKTSTKYFKLKFRKKKKNKGTEPTLYFTSLPISLSNGGNSSGIPIVKSVILSRLLNLIDAPRAPPLKCL